MFLLWVSNVFLLWVSDMVLLWVSAVFLLWASAVFSLWVSVVFFLGAVLWHPQLYIFVLGAVHGTHNSTVVGAVLCYCCG